MSKKDPRFRISRWKSGDEVVFIMAPCKIKLLVKKTKRSKEWVEGVTYKDFEQQNYYVMEKKEFFAKFIPLNADMSSEVIDYCTDNKKGESDDEEEK